ncbi:MAG: tetratricopeptide repeat protein [Anaerolineales bacterium]|nr:tetratricopeptide repeat protein [Anaerolineales bacterium]
MDQPHTFGEWVRRRRKALDLTQAALAERAHCSKAAIVKIEAGERRPSRELAALLAEVLQVPPAERAAFTRAARGEQAPPPAPTAAAPRPSRLPASATPLVGRDQELEQIGRLLAEAECRLLTLTGPGGAGKTRLALEAARRWAAGGLEAVFVPLAPLETAERLAPAIASALGFSFNGPSAPAQQVLDYLRDKTLLLVLDNLEHLLAGADFLAEVLAWAPAVKLLATSRERLRLRGEWVLDVQGLPLAVPDDAPGTNGAAEALFLQAARRARPGFQLTPADRPAVARICQMVDGLPLGIELAAAWAGGLPVAAIAAEIARNSDFLSQSLRDGPERQRSLRAAFDYSWRLLSEAEQRALRRLAIFRGAFTPAAAERVAGAGPLSVAALTDKSLLRPSGAERYDLHDLVRQFAAGRLADLPAEYAAAREAFGAFYAERLEVWGAALRGPGQLAALAEMEAEFDDVRQAWDWLCAARAAAPLARALAAVWRFCELRGWFEAGAALLERAVAALEAEGAALGAALTYQAWFLMYLGQLGPARQKLAAGRALLEAGPDRGLLAETLFALGSVHMLAGQVAEATQLMQASLDLSRAAGDAGRLALSLAGQGTLHLVRGELEPAYALLSEATRHARAVGDPYQLAAGVGALGAAAGALGRPAEAERLLLESLELYRAINNPLRVSKVYGQLGRLALSRGDLAQAEVWLRESLNGQREVGERSGLAVALNQLGWALLPSRPAEAGPIFAEAELLAAQAGVAYPRLDAWLGRLATGRASAADLPLLLKIMAEPACQGEVRARAQALLDERQAGLPPEALAAAQAQAAGADLEALARAAGVAETKPA